ncbi:MAG: Gfo/Idh/MocA family oxidoreductase [Sedimentisphaerales bacterium]|nr:Gfo/Idh/MocA family oxidoreductase [Sedimentisphaerales bacterium]
MQKINRRNFLQRSLATTTGLGISLGFQNSVWSQVRGANNDIRVGIAGIRSQGNGHIDRFQGLPGVRVVALCDPDRQILDKRVAELTARIQKENSSKDHPTQPSKVNAYTDVREMLDNKDIDAIVIAAPNHWHSLMTVWACQAGKHVYVEKPVSHSIWEGRQMVHAARKYNRVVQAGTQQRSCPAVQEAAADIQAGKYGKALWVHCSKLDARETIGKVNEPQPVPDYIDYNLWAGPAPMTPVMRKSFHYDWHWQWNWGDGEMGNWGIHYVDDLRNLLGWPSVPTSVIAAGNRFLWDDNGQTPNMHFALFDYDGLKVVVDIRNLPDPARPGGKSGAVYQKSRGGNYIQFENAFIRIARGGGAAYDLEGNRIKQYKGDGGSSHVSNFINAVRNNSNKDLNAEIEVSHLSAAMCHQANIGFRVGSQASVDQARASMKEHDDALNTLNDMLEQLDGNKVNLKEKSFVLGPKLNFDRKTESFVGDHAQAANKYLKRSYRPPFVLPEKV